jgi:hypothetical protein
VNRSLEGPDSPSTLPEDLSTAPEYQETIKRQPTVAYQETSEHQETGDHQEIARNQESAAQIASATERYQHRIKSRLKLMGPLVGLVVFAWKIVGSFYYTTLAVSISITWLYWKVMAYRVWREGSWKTGASHFIRLLGLLPFVFFFLCLSPLHVFLSPLDLWTKYQDQPTVGFQTLYDPGESATLE